MNIFSRLFESLRPDLLSQPDAFESPAIKKEFQAKRFAVNNVRIFLASFFLSIEQLFYALFFSPDCSPVQAAHFISSGVLLLFTVFSVLFILYKPKKINRLLSLYSISLAVFGLVIAVIRLIIARPNPFSLPTVYVAVIYGIAVVFYLSYFEAAVMYCAVSACSIILIHELQISPLLTMYIADIISNAGLAYIISFLNYRGFLRDFQNRTIIRRSNKKLVQKNQHIKKINQKLLVLSEQDGLTKMFNRRKLDQLLCEEWTRFERYSCAYSIVILDIDLFKQINDTYGHTAGDDTLRRFTDIIKAELRGADSAGRWGGEEFLVICRETSLLQAARFADRLRERLASAFYESAGTVTASFGVASIEEVHTPEALLILADTRLYEAKHNGRNCVVSGISSECIV